MHEQDVRRAVGRPGGLDSAPARHTADYLAESLGYVLGKKVGAPVGTSLVAGDRRAASRSRSRSTRTAVAGGPRAAGRAHRDAAHGPRVVHPAGRRPLPGRAGPGDRRGRPGARRAGSWRVSPHPVRVDAWAARRHPRPGRPHRGGHRARRWAGSATTPRSSWPAAALGSCWRAAPRNGSRDRATRSGGGAGRRARAAGGRPRRPGRRYAARRRRPRSTARIDVLVNNAGVMGTPHRLTTTDSTCSWRPTTSGRSCSPGCCCRSSLASKDARVVTVSSNMHRVARRAPLGDPHVHGRSLREVARLRTVQAGQPAVHLRARPPRPGQGAAPQGAGRASRLRRHPPRGQRPVRPLQRVGWPRSSTRASRPSRSRPHTAPGRC